MTTSDDLQARWARLSAALAKANALNKTNLFGALAAAGITHACIGFDGEGDSGQIESASAQADGKVVVFPATMVTLHRASYGSEELTTHDIPLAEAVEELCYGYLEQEYGGWENNDGAFGEFTFDVAARSIQLDFNGRISDYVHSSHTF